MIEELRMYCVVAQESLDKMGGNRGKLGAQTGHAFLHAFWDSTLCFPDYAASYKSSQAAVKIVLITLGVADLQTLYEAYSKVCGVSMVTDAGRTVFGEPTVTCLGIGPLPQNLIGDDLKELRLLI